MICTCQTCKRPFWRYRRDFPPPGVCSIPCFHDRRIDEDEKPPELPHVVLRRLRQHLTLIHDSDSMLIWPNCDSCEELQEEYAASLNYHYDRVTAEIAGKPRKQKKPMRLVLTRKRRAASN